MTDRTTSCPGPPGAITHMIEVEVALEQFHIEVSQPRVAVRPGDIVVWQFRGLPADWTPWISFTTSGPVDQQTDPVGPLEQITQSTASVWGVIGDVAPGSSFAYRPAIQRGLGIGGQVGAQVVGTSASLASLDAGRGCRWVFQVARSGNQLEVTPAQVTIEPEDTVLFDFSSVVGGVAGLRPRVTFNRFTGQGDPPNLFFGPFTSMVTTGQTVLGQGNCGVGGFYTFEVAVISIATGVVEWLASTDPTVDNMGPPGGGGG